VALKDAEMFDFVIYESMAIVLRALRGENSGKLEN
jgi:hypothetical protein